MVTGHFIPLARADEQREISVCRHGVVHLNWWNMTLRFMPRDFERLASVLQDGKTMVVSLGPHCDGDICLSSRDGRGYVLTIGPVSLTLNAAEYRSLSDMAQQARQHLETVLASRAWTEPEVELQSANPLPGLRSPSFSVN